MYRDLGFLRVWGGQSTLDGPSELRGVDYAYLIYPHKPIVAYLPQTGRLLNEYCVEFPDETRPYGSPRLPDSDDVLAKWMALNGDERRVISEANLHLPGRQIDPRQIQRDLWRLGRWERERLARALRAESLVTRIPSRPTAELDPKHRSRQLTEGVERAPARSYLHGIGFDAEALSKPIIGVASTWTETMPCNFGLRTLAAKVKEGIRAAGGTPMEFNTIAISDGITMGTSGMKTSLVCREVVADSIELVARGHLFDGIVALTACDKTIPGAAMALARLDVPGVLLYGGSILPGHYKGADDLDPRGVRGRRCARGREDLRRGAARARGGRLAGHRRLRRPVHRQHDGDGVRGAGPEPDGLRDGSRRLRGQEPRRARGRRADHGRPRPRPAAERHHHPRGPGERDRGRRHQRRLHERRPASARARARGRHPARDRRLRPDRGPDAHDVRPQARRPLPRQGPLRRRRRRRRRQAPARRGHPARGRADRHRPHDRRARPRGGGDARPGGRPPARRPGQEDRRPGDPARQPRARGLAS